MLTTTTDTLANTARNSKRGALLLTLQELQTVMDLMIEADREAFYSGALTFVIGFAVGAAAVYAGLSEFIG